VIASLRARALGIALGIALAAGAAATPSDSLYQLEIPLVDQSGRATAFDRERGHPLLVSLFYTSCDFVCPTLVSTLQRLEAELDVPARGRLRVLLVSLDPERDTPEQLARAARRHRVDLARWSLTRASEDDLRALAALLGAPYRRLPDGEFNHATAISLLDAEGRLVARSETLGRLDADFLARLRAATSAPPGD